MMEGPGADSEEKHEPVSDIDTAAVDSLKALDPERPIREATKASPMPAHDCLRPDDHHRLEDRWTPSIQQDEEQPIAVGELNPATHLSL